MNEVLKRNLVEEQFPFGTENAPFDMLRPTPRRRHLRTTAITAGVLLAVTALFFTPLAGRALGGIFALSADGATVASYPDWLFRQSTKHDWGYVEYSHIPTCLEHAIIAVEDKRFLYHNGIDPIALLRVLAKDVENGRMDHGGSTLLIGS